MMLSGSPCSLREWSSSCWTDDVIAQAPPVQVRHATYTAQLFVWLDAGEEVTSGNDGLCGAQSGGQALSQFAATSAMWFSTL